MITKENIRDKTIVNLIKEFPFLEKYFSDNSLPLNGKANLAVKEYFSSFTDSDFENKAFDPENLFLQMIEYINSTLAFLGNSSASIDSITILPGLDKNGKPENFTSLEIKKNQIISIVGPTGSGKSRLLADIEWVAQRDTPTKRQILINNEIPEKKWRFSSSDKLVAQLSQNMNFVMDLTVKEFLDLHAESRMIENRETVIEKIIDEGNKLAGEKFRMDTPITSLSGGQSRALMIADTAILSKSPIILIDEIENAGIDRKKALKLLISEEKIVLIATHDPILALMAEKRLIIKNGAIMNVFDTSRKELDILKDIEEMDNKIKSLRAKLRNGEELSIE